MIKALLVWLPRLSVLVTAGILFAVVEPAVEFFSRVPAGEFFSSSTEVGSNGVFPLVLGPS